MNFDKLPLESIKKYASSISGEWNGDDPGIREDRAKLAEEAIKKIEELEGTLKELKELR